MKCQSTMVLVVLAMPYLMPCEVLGQEYKSLADVVADIQSLASGSLGDATATQLKDSGNAVILTAGATTNVPIWLLKIDKSGCSGDAEILVTGQQHAQEWVAYRAVMKAGDFILTNKSSASWPSPDSRFDHFRLFKEMNIHDLTDNARIYLVPLVNPEGYHYSKDVNQDDLNAPMMGGWRKNRRNVANDPSIANEPPPQQDLDTELDVPLIGVDLNRNYPSADWGTVTTDELGRLTTSRIRWDRADCGHPSGASWTNPVTRPPVAEKEQEAIATLSVAHDFGCHIDVHSFRGTVGWVQSADPTGQNLRPHGGCSDKEVLQVLGAKAAEMIMDPNGTKYTPEASPYPTSGDTLVWQYEHRGSNCLPFLIEINKVAPGYPLNTKFAPINATAHADAVLPGQLFMMFAAVDKSFSSKPTARFRKP